MSELNRREFLASGLLLAGIPPLLSQDKIGGLVIHEWGVFTVADGATWGSARTSGITLDHRKTEIASNPPAFALTWSQLVEKAIEKWEQQPIIITKPVVYFYSKVPATVDFKVGVPEGRPAVWWPPASEWAPAPILPSRALSLGEDLGSAPTLEKIPPKQGFLRWRLEINPKGSSEGFKPVHRDHWWHTARDTDAAPVVAEKESERFIFYDALSPLKSSLGIRWRDDTSVAIKNIGAHEIEHILVVRVHKGTAWVAWIDSLTPASEVVTKAVEGTPLGFVDRLVRSGLFEKEAVGMEKIWAKEFFQADGFRVIYWMPAPAIEAVLPMSVKPSPEKIVRILLAHVECLGPDGEREVERLIELIGSDDLEERAKAADRLQKLGPQVESALRHAVRNSKDSEIQARAQAILESLGVTP